MIERALVEYLVNALWQIPLLAGGAWLLLRTVRPGPRIRHRVWLGVLGLAVLLPMHGMDGTSVLAVQPQHITTSTEEHGAWPQEPLGLLPKSDWRWIRGPWLELSPRLSSVRLPVTTAHWLVSLYLATIVFALFRIARAWRAARQLVAYSRETSLCDRNRAVLQDYGRRLGIKVPRLRQSGDVPSPMIVGVVAPVLLLPEGFARYTEDEVSAALCHELAHIKRRDYLMNAICQMAALPVAWHPVVYAVQQCIRRTREMVCDAMAAKEMKSEIRYAKCLLALAHSMLGARGMVERAQFLGLFSSNILEERVMRLMEAKTMSVRAKAVRLASGAAVMIATTSIAAMFHVTPTMAESGTGAPSEATQSVAAASQTQPRDWFPIGALPAITPAREPRKPVPAKQRQVEKKFRQPVDDAQWQISEATAKVNSPEFKKQMADAQQQALEATAKVYSPEFKKQIEDAQRQALEATAKLNSPEFRQQMEDVQRQVSEATAKVNSPEFQRQMENLQKQLQSGEFQRRMEEACRNRTRARKLARHRSCTL